MARAVPLPQRSVHRVALALLVITLMVVVGTAAFSVFLCSFATYSCPSNGCGTVPQQNCRSSTQLVGEVLAVGAPLAAMALASVLWLRRPRGAAPPGAPS